MKPRSKETISYTMSKIKGKSTGIEVLLRKALLKRGIKSRHNSKFIFGHPDLSWKGYKVVVFCDSEFWHGYHFEEAQKKLHSHQDYWIPKIERNIARDVEVNAELQKEGYTVLRYWGVRIEKETDAVADEIAQVLKEKGYPI
jgi:DNA mismatch endonuclease (patch repair protein)